MRILLLKSLLLCTNCPSFLPILCGILLFLPWIPFVSAVDSFCFCRGFVFAVNPFCFCRGILFIFVVDLFLLWICFCCGFLCVYFFFLFCFCLFSLVPSIISHEIRKTWEFFGKKSIVFWKKSIVFWGLLSNV